MTLIKKSLSVLFQEVKDELKDKEVDKNSNVQKMHFAFSKFEKGAIEVLGRLGE